MSRHPERQSQQFKNVYANNDQVRESLKANEEEKKQALLAVTTGDVSVDEDKIKKSEEPVPAALGAVVTRQKTAVKKRSSSWCCFNFNRRNKKAEGKSAMPPQQTVALTH